MYGFCVDYNNSCEYLEMKNSKGFTYVQDLAGTL